MIAPDKTVKISDFGLAGVLDASKATSAVRLSIRQGRVGLSGSIMEGKSCGTPTHMPPEQFTDAASCDQKSDIYAFGVVLHQMASRGKLARALPRTSRKQESFYKEHSDFVGICLEQKWTLLGSIVEEYREGILPDCFYNARVLIFG